jgi:acetyl-CoA C-acetyltransferase
MTQRVAIVGIGQSGFRPVTPDLSYRELIYEAATKAYQEAGVTPHEVDNFITCEEDFMAGYSIADEYTPDQLGAVLKPVHTVPGDMIQGIAAATMIIQTGIAKLAVVEAYSKASNITTLNEVVNFAFDPILTRNLDENYFFVGGLEMSRYLYETAVTREQCAQVVVKNKAQALKNPLASFGGLVTVEDVLNSEPVSLPLNRLDIAPHVDGCVVVVLADEETAKRLSAKPIWIRGIGWCSDSYALEWRDLGISHSTRLAAEQAYRMAGINSPLKEIDLVEVNDEMSFKELQHLEALKFCPMGLAGDYFEAGHFDAAGELPVNLSGGNIGVGNLFEANGGHRVYEVVKQLRGEAGAVQLKDAKTGLAHAWRGIPTNTSCVVILSN